MVSIVPGKFSAGVFESRERFQARHVNIVKMIVKFIRKGI
jgi:hypothetical protein